VKTETVGCSYYVLGLADFISTVNYRKLEYAFQAIYSQTPIELYCLFPKIYGLI